MNTTNPNEDLFADFFKVGGNTNQYNNFTSIPRNLIKSDGGKSSLTLPLTALATKGRKNSIGGLIYKKFTTLYDRVSQDFKLTDKELDDAWSDWKLKGNSTKDTSTFYRFVEVEKGNTILQEQIVNDTNILRNDSIDISDIDFSEKKKIPYVYIGIGVVAIVGITILIVKR